MRNKNREKEIDQKANKEKRQTTIENKQKF